MQDSIHPKRLTRARRARVLAAAALVSGVLVAGCGGSSPSPTPTSSSAARGSATTTGSSTATGGSATSSGSTRQAPPRRGRSRSPSACAPTACPTSQTRTPDAEGCSPSLESTLIARVQGGAGEVPEAHGRRPPRPRLDDAPLRTDAGEAGRIARCMRQHGVPNSPTPGPPSRPTPLGINEITDFDGVILLFPSTINLQAPAYRQALTACGAPPLGLPH